MTPLTIGSLALSALSSGIGAIAGTNSYNKLKAENEARQQQNQNWYDREYYGDATQKADAQRLLGQTRDALLRSNRANAGAAAMGGASAESVASAKAASANAMADAASAINAQNVARKDNLTQQYQQRADILSNQKSQLEADRRANIAQATTGALNAAAQLGMAQGQSGVYDPEGLASIGEDIRTANKAAVNSSIANQSGQGQVNIDLLNKIK